MTQEAQISNEERKAILERDRPPTRVIREAVRVANLSPCDKSKRGVVLYNEPSFDRWASSPQLAHLENLTLSTGFNGPPPGFKCLGRNKCGSDCARVCLHAEDRAIRGAASLSDITDHVLVHVKAVNGELVPGGPPSCEACSKVIADVGIRAVWLFEATRWHDELRCQACYEVTVIEQGRGTTGVCAKCDRIGKFLNLGQRVYDLASGEWRRYEAAMFHLTTLNNLALPYAYSKPRTP